MMLDVWWRLVSMGFFTLERKVQKTFVGQVALKIRMAL